LKNRGIALLMGLLLLAAVSLLALMAANGMVLQRRMAANFSDEARALAEATRATVAARDWLYSRGSSEREYGCVSGCYLPTAIYHPGDLPRNPEFESDHWWQSHAVAVGSHPESGAPLGSEGIESDPPRWLIEELLFAPPEPTSGEAADTGVAYYRILARGQGNRPGSVAVTESIIARPWGGDATPLPYPHQGSPVAFCRQFDRAVDCGTQAWRQRR
jgi:Tfp pilus assembly protein PilX